MLPWRPCSFRFSPEFWTFGWSGASGSRPSLRAAFAGGTGGIFFLLTWFSPLAGIVCMIAIPFSAETLRQSALSETPAVLCPYLNEIDLPVAGDPLLRNRARLLPFNQRDRATTILLII